MDTETSFVLDSTPSSSRRKISAKEERLSMKNLSFKTKDQLSRKQIRMKKKKIKLIAHNIISNLELQLANLMMNKLLTCKNQRNI
jgi:hypothetical protein